MFVRVFCMPAETPLGDLTRTFIDIVVVELGWKVRLLPVPGAHIDLDALPAPWAPYRDLFATVVDGPYCNVVASNSSLEWTHLWTNGVSNVLVTTTEPPPMDPQHLIYHGAYMAVVVPPSTRGELVATWKSTRVRPLVLPEIFSNADKDAIRDVLLM